MTVESSVFTCVKSEKPELNHLVGMTFNMWEWFKKTGLLGYALENKIENQNYIQKIELIKDKAGVYLIENKDGQLMF